MFLLRLACLKPLIINGMIGLCLTALSQPQKPSVMNTLSTCYPTPKSPDIDSDIVGSIASQPQKLYYIDSNIQWRAFKQPQKTLDYIDSK